MKLTPLRVAALARNWCVRRIRRVRIPHGFILMYHRIATPVVDPWNICVSPEYFAAQMKALAEIADVVPLEALPDSLRSGRRSRPVGAITFDDAYLDNLTIAKPVLDAHDLPATVFMPTGWINESRPMWWDRLAHALLAAPELPVTLELRAHERDFSWQEPQVNAQGTAGQRSRQHLHRAIWSRMRQLADDDARHDVMDCLVERLGTNEMPVATARAMTSGELGALTADGRIRIGSHAVSHPSLPGLDRKRKEWEIEHSAEHCRELIGTRPATFAYPFGDLDAECVELVRASGYSLACSTREDLLWEGEDPHLLPRITVGNWSAREFQARLNWYWLA